MVCRREVVLCRTVASAIYSRISAIIRPTRKRLRYKLAYLLHQTNQLTSKVQNSLLQQCSKRCSSKCVSKVNTSFFWYTSILQVFKQIRRFSVTWSHCRNQIQVSGPVAQGFPLAGDGWRIEGEICQVTYTQSDFTGRLTTPLTYRPKIYVARGHPMSFIRHCIRYKSAGASVTQIGFRPPPVAQPEVATLVVAGAEF